MRVLDPIKRQKTLTEQAADAIRTRIIEGQLEFGEALNEIALANELELSKTPLREAFLQLKHEGLVEIFPRRGSFVFRMTLEDIKYVIEALEILEVNSLQLSIKDGGEPLNESLSAIIIDMKQDNKSVISKGWINREYEFHNAIVRASGNPFIEAAYYSVALRIQALRNRIRDESQYWRVHDELVLIADHAKRNDLEAGSQALIRSIRNTFYDYVALQSDTTDRAVS